MTSPRTFIVTLCLAALGACAGEDVPSPCPRIAYTCTAGPGYVRVRHAADAPLPFSGPDADGHGADLVLENDRIAVVLDALDQPHLLAPTGGTIIDLAPRGGADQLNQIYTVAGILPDDAFHYDSLQIIDEAPRLVAVIARGWLDGRRDLRVATRYELRPCEPGVRVRSELVNGAPEPYAMALLDVSYWGSKQPVPFVVAPDQGFLPPALDLEEVDRSWGSYPLVAARATSPPYVSYGFVGCDREALDGVNDTDVTAVGTPRTILQPGESLTLERMLLTADGVDVENVARLARELRGKLGLEPAQARLAGRVVAGGQPFGGSETRASIVVSEIAGTGRRPVTEVVPGADGRFEVRVPLGPRYELEVWSFGRAVVTDAPTPDPAGEVGDLVVPAPARLAVRVRAAGLPDVPLDAAVSVVPADAATRAATTGTQRGLFGGCAPWLGPPHGASPACNHVVLRGDAAFELPGGHYLVYASHGPLWTLARAEVTLQPGEVAPLAFTLAPLPGLADGLLSVDLHVHGMRSFDASIPDADRVLSFAAAGVDVLAATDHDAVTDYEDGLATLGLRGKLHVLAGVETTGAIPFLRVPGDDVPHVIGHFNFYPVVYAPGASRGGAPWDELMEPGMLFDRMDAILRPGGLRMLNHPWDDVTFGRDQGYLRAIGYDPRLPIPAVDDGTRNGILARRPGGGHSNLDFQVIEVMNGRDVPKSMKYRSLWWALLSGGHLFAGAANSDSHSLSDTQVGWPRNLIAAPGAYDEAALLGAIRAGHMVGGNGVVITARIDGASPGVALPALRVTAGARLHITVKAAPWIPVEEIRVIVNGQVARTLASASLARPADPFGQDGLTRFDGDLELAPLLPGGGDAWLLVEAGLPLPLAADLDDDGVIDTGDNNHDGVVDRADVKPGDASGPFAAPEDPDPWSGDARAPLVAVEPGTWPFAFTNPFLLDVDGDGAWQAPRP